MDLNSNKTSHFYISRPGDLGVHKNPRQQEVLKSYNDFLRLPHSFKFINQGQNLKHFKEKRLLIFSTNLQKATIGF